jgi:hypothetical protein
MKFLATTVNHSGLPPQVLALLFVVAAGMLLNFGMFLITIRRKARLEPCGNVHKDRIARVTVYRAMRVEFGFFVCQFVRFVHTFYEVHALNGNNIYRTDTWAVLERGFVTLVLVMLSIWDLHDRKIIGDELSRTGGQW